MDLNDLVELDARYERAARAAARRRAAAWTLALVAIGSLAYVAAHFIAKAW